VRAENRQNTKSEDGLVLYGDNYTLYPRTLVLHHGGKAVSSQAGSGSPRRRFHA
jgi:hypothetical protein